MEGDGGRWRRWRRWRREGGIGQGPLLDTPLLDPSDKCAQRYLITCKRTLRTEEDYGLELLSQFNLTKVHCVLIVKRKKLLCVCVYIYIAVYILEFRIIIVLIFIRKGKR